MTGRFGMVTVGTPQGFFRSDSNLSLIVLFKQLLIVEAVCWCKAWPVNLREGKFNMVTNHDSPVLSGKDAGEALERSSLQGVHPEIGSSGRTSPGRVPAVPPTQEGNGEEG